MPYNTFSVPNGIHKRYRKLTLVWVLNVVSCIIRGCSEKYSAQQWKNEFIISKLFLLFNIIFLKTNTFIPAMLQGHYPVPVVVVLISAKYPSTAAIASWFEKKVLTSEEVFEFWEEIEVRRSQIYRVDVQTIHSADPLIFPLPKHFCGRVQCPDERWFFFFANRVPSHEFFRLVRL